MEVISIIFLAILTVLFIIGTIGTVTAIFQHNKWLNEELKRWDKGDE